MHFVQGFGGARCLTRCALRTVRSSMPSVRTISIDRMLRKTNTELPVVGDGYVEEIIERACVEPVAELRAQPCASAHRRANPRRVTGSHAF